MAGLNRSPEVEPAGGLSAARAALLASMRPEISDERVMEAIGRVPRERFLDAGLRGSAYLDRPLPIGHGQTTSQPRMIALMLQELHLSGGEKVLEVGAGCGYQTALLAELAGEVVGVELVAGLAERASKALADMGYGNVSIKLAQESIGWPAEAPYAAIVVAAASPRIPLALLDQLAPGGRLAIPVGSRRGQQLVVAEKRPEGVTLTRRGACSFVPLLGRDAFSAEL